MKPHIFHCRDGWVVRFSSIDRVDCLFHTVQEISDWWRWIDHEQRRFEHLCLGGD